jgi:hypothetical protein
VGGPREEVWTAQNQKFSKTSHHTPGPPNFSDAVEILIRSLSQVSGLEVHWVALGRLV